MRPGFLPIAISAVLAAIAFAQSQSPIQLEPEKTLNRDLAGGADLFALDLKTDRQNKKLLMQKWNWVGEGKKAKGEPKAALKRRIEEELHRFERFQLGD